MSVMTVGTNPVNNNVVVRTPMNAGASAGNASAAKLPQDSVTLSGTARVATAQELANQKMGELRNAGDNSYNQLRTMTEEKFGADNLPGGDRVAGQMKTWLSDMERNDKKFFAAFASKGAPGHAEAQKRYDDEQRIREASAWAQAMRSDKPEAVNLSISVLTNYSEMQQIGRDLHNGKYAQNFSDYSFGAGKPATVLPNVSPGTAKALQAQLAMQGGR
jgi:hypothetical protein